MRSQRALAPFVLIFLTFVAVPKAWAQGPTIDSPLPAAPGAGEPLLGRAPGSGAAALGSGPGTDDQILGGRPGASTPRVPVSISTPGGQAPSPGSTFEVLPQPKQAESPILGSLAIPKLLDEGPAGAMTLDVAIDRLVRENLDLRAQYIEIPQAQADILTASLRANPILYADAQLIPYGSYDDKKRPGGQTQYDVNISYPLDITHKRKARTVVACRAKKVVEAQFQNAVRLQIDNLYAAYVDLLAAKSTVRFSQIGVEGLTQALAATKELQKRGERTAADVRRVQIQLDNAQIGLVANESVLLKTKRAFGLILALPPEEAESLELRGTLRDLLPEPPTMDQLVSMAIQNRPDLAAFRLGVARAEANVRLAHANRLSDIYLLLQPYTFQDNQPQGLKSATSYAVGVTVPLPIYNRNQGNIQRAKLNVAQTQIQLAALERQIANEVRQAESEFRVNFDSVRKLESDVNPAAERVLSDSERLYRGGEYNVLDYLNARSQYNDVARQYLDTLIRYRRSMLGLNTAVGVRVVP